MSTSTQQVIDALVIVRDYLAGQTEPSGRPILSALTDKEFECYTFALTLDPVAFELRRRWLDKTDDTDDLDVATQQVRELANENTEILQGLQRAQRESAAQSRALSQIKTLVSQF